MKPYPLMTHPLGLALRSLARKTGLVTLVAPFLKSRAYEEAFSKALLDEVAPGDCAWDIGANVGYYTVQLAARVGVGGRVVAFEPSPRNFPKLEAACRFASNSIITIRCGLGSSGGFLPFILSNDESGVTDRIRPDNTPPDPSEVKVEIIRGDEFVRQHPNLSPNVLKIDVEGFEDEVLVGLQEAIRNPSLRALFVEIHFGSLERRGKRNAPNTIYKILTGAGFAVTWLDHSHLVAKRPT